MRTLVLVLALSALAPRVAEAGPYCGALQSLAPADQTELPVAPTVTLHVEDAYYNGKRRGAAHAPKIRATIDGKKVPIATRDVRTADGVMRFITIKSKRTGTLRVSTVDRWGSELAQTYEIVKDWTAPDPTVSIARGADTRLGPYRWVGKVVALRIDVPAIAFTVKWGKHKQRIAPTIETDHSEAWLGQRMCGMVENVPLRLLEEGVDVTVTATLPDGREVQITDLPSPLVMPPGPEPRVGKQ
jgi:hypothetical protein